MNEFQISAFWSKVNIAESTKECWPWSGAKNPKGYGHLTIGKMTRNAHRVAFEIANGEIPNGYMVCHVCDNPACCNPSHLMLGTQNSNMADMLLKLRGKKPEHAARGSVNGNAKLTEDDVKNIRAAYQNKEMDQYQLARKYSVSQPAIGAIVRRETWRHV